MKNLFKFWRALAFLLCALLPVACPLNAWAANRISITVTITNLPTTGNTFVLNSNTRTWTTNSAPTSLQFKIGSSINASATNMYQAIAANGFAGNINITQPATNQVKLIGQVGQNMAASLTGGWGMLSVVTNAANEQTTFNVPLSYEPSATVRTNVASGAVDGINSYASNYFLLRVLPPGLATNFTTTVPWLTLSQNNSILSISTNATKIAIATYTDNNASGLTNFPSSLALSSRNINTASPLQGGGDLSADRTLSILQSSAAQNGYLSSNDWTTFNGKVSTSRSISTTAPLTGGGDLSADRTLSIPAADAVTDGYLKATDWVIFNGTITNVVPSGTGYGLVSGVSSRVATLRDIAAGSGISISTNATTMTISSSGGVGDALLAGNQTWTGTNTWNAPGLFKDQVRIVTLAATPFIISNNTGLAYLSFQPNNNCETIFQGPSGGTFNYNFRTSGNDWYGIATHSGANWKMTDSGGTFEVQSPSFASANQTFQVSGNLTIGDNANDSVTLNASTITIGPAASFGGGILKLYSSSSSNSSFGANLKLSKGLLVSRGVTATNYAMSPYEHYISIIGSTSATVTVTLPPKGDGSVVTNGFVVEVFDGQGHGSNTNGVLNTSDSTTINWSANKSITNDFGSIRAVFDGSTNWEARYAY